MPGALHPSDRYYALTPERLAIVGRIVWDARVLAAVTARWEDGATNFSVGLLAWLYGKKKLSDLAREGTYPWLSVGEEGAHYIIKMAGCPLRFCSGDEESPLRENYRHPSARERADLQLAFDSSELTRGDIFFRLLVTADAVGMPIALILAECDMATGEILGTWPIRLSDDGDAGIAPFVSPKAPVVLPGLRLETHEEAERREQEQRAREESQNGNLNPRGA